MFGFGHSLTLLGSKGGVADAADGAALAGLMLVGETDGLAIDFRDLSIAIKDTATPANTFTGNVNNKLTSAAPSAKRVLGRNGLLVSASNLQTVYNSAGTALGVMFEQGATNVHLQSEDFSSASWTKGANTSVTANQYVAPDGTTTADAIVCTAGSAQKRVYPAAGTFTAGTWTQSVFAKETADCRYLAITMFDTVYKGAAFDLRDGSVDLVSGATTTVEPLPNGWYRLAVTVTTTATMNRAASGYWPYATVPAALGNNETAACTGCLWGAQLENRASMSSYIPTTVSTVARAHDDVSILSSLFNMSTTQGTWLIDAYHGGNAFSYAVVFECANGARTSYVTAFGSSSTAAAIQTYAGATQAQYNVTTSLGSRYLLAMSTKTNDFNGAVNGVAGAADTTGTFPNDLSRLQFGAASATPGFEGNCIIRRFMHLPRTSTAPQLATLSTP